MIGDGDTRRRQIKQKKGRYTNIISSPFAAANMRAVLPIWSRDEIEALFSINTAAAAA